MDGYSFFADDDETLMPKGRVERRGGDHLTDFIPDEVGTFEPGLKDEATDILSDYVRGN